MYYHHFLQEMTTKSNVSTKWNSTLPSTAVTQQKLLALLQSLLLCGHWAHVRFISSSSVKPARAVPLLSPVNRWGDWGSESHLANKWGLKDMPLHLINSKACSPSYLPPHNCCRKWLRFAFGYKFDELFILESHYRFKYFPTPVYTWVWEKVITVEVTGVLKRKSTHLPSSCIDMEEGFLSSQPLSFSFLIENVRKLWQLTRAHREGPRAASPARARLQLAVLPASSSPTASSASFQAVVPEALRDRGCRGLRGTDPLQLLFHLTGFRMELPTPELQLISDLSMSWLWVFRAQPLREIMPDF